MLVSDIDRIEAIFRLLVLVSIVIIVDILEEDSIDVKIIILEEGDIMTILAYFIKLPQKLVS